MGDCFWSRNRGECEMCCADLGNGEMADLLSGCGSWVECGETAEEGG